MPPPPIRPPMWNQPQIPGTDLPPMPSGNAFPPPPPPGTSVSFFFIFQKIKIIRFFYAFL